ncbi:hypothetical protein CTRI78_v009073 [Colletotrichum trifolii]|uniref:Uncharacterized protein n=1 Tax=Colletotrichum trifolii TaxID=5466 RepID=A0A4R8QRL0_COLTR|nr:hypothetical protein CTRI78_v009073 [Colletotrichum trifolii]
MMSRPIQAKTQFLQVLRQPTPLRFQNHLIPQLSLTLRLPHISIPDPCDLTPQSLISTPPLQLSQETKRPKTRWTSSATSGRCSHHHVPRAFSSNLAWLTPPVKRHGDEEQKGGI